MAATVLLLIRLASAISRTSKNPRDLFEELVVCSFTALKCSNNPFIVNGNGRPFWCSLILSRVRTVLHCVLHSPLPQMRKIRKTAIKLESLTFKGMKLFATSV